MSLMASPWRRGMPHVDVEAIPLAERCMYCGGKGFTMAKHTFGKGYEHWPCFHCHGKGRQELDVKAVEAVPEKQLVQ